ncbi:hypothetical protein GobsT_18680 [Gemmata obscuriglobus]|uniref:Uncharacterized protein n=1 Tax=Gemmata obscuriglobus TaxID=114 RepID=A0A2Z3HEP7_9BACT|nr:hypothetical protein [Gemmata obscuriglobus]AWM39770.1 hypothetical protein C1280_24045 [Gemmata obscuriglobus]QEG27115.1 hypothetical protein GobsT_18680 [Gemmata obscuriglobus]VTS03640.1 unnamed protein product [Gemmata obscuriglobus UQM 2246]
MLEGDVEKFLRWNNEGKRKLWYGTLMKRSNPEEYPGNESELYQGGKRVSIEEMEERADEWLEQNGRTMTAQEREQLVLETIRRVLDGHE